MFMLVGTVVGHFAGIAASIIIGGWAATFIASQVGRNMLSFSSEHVQQTSYTNVLTEGVQKTPFY